MSMAISKEFKCITAWRLFALFHSGKVWVSKETYTFHDVQQQVTVALKDKRVSSVALAVFPIPASDHDKIR